MSELSNLPNGSWILVADGTGGRLFEASVEHRAVSLKKLDHLEPENLIDSGPSGSRPPEQTYQQTDEATFAKQLAESLYSHAHSSHYRNLVVIADPQTLGQLREILHQEVSQKIGAEIPKTLTNHSQKDIEEALTAMLAD